MEYYQFFFITVGLVIVRGNDHGMRTLLFVHASLAFGSMIAPLTCIFFVNSPVSNAVEQSSTGYFYNSPFSQVHKGLRAVTYFSSASLRR